MDEKGLSKLLPKSITTKRRRKKAASAEEAVDEPPRGRSLAIREQTDSDRDGSGSLHLDDDDDHSTLQDEDSRIGSPSRPGTFSTHPSQIGYLTTSSPLVQANHLPEVVPIAIESPSSPGGAGTTDETPETASSLASSQSGLKPLSTKSTRSVSPVGRLVGVFKARKSSGATSNSSPERHPTEHEAETASAARSNESAHIDSASDAAKPAANERVRRLSRGQKHTVAPPKTPPAGEKAAPVIVNTPPTPPIDSNASTFETSPTRSSTSVAATSADATTSPSNMLGHRRARSGSGNLGPSKLSNITLAPLTPTPEDGVAPPPSAGFFSSMISAAQNATNTFSNTITNTNLSTWNGSSSKRSSSSKEKLNLQDDQIESEPSAEATSQYSMEGKEPAIKTIGTGELSLSQLGFNEPGSNITSPTMSRFQDSNDARNRSESAPTETFTVAAENLADDSQFAARPRSLHEPNPQLDRTTPTGSVYEGQTGVRRNGSIRSAIGRHRKRGSSIATGGTAISTGTIGAAITAANASVANPSAQPGAPKLTGFAVASKKRNRDFHTQFKSVPDDDYLIEDYSCALQKEILAHGRLYVSEGHLCFSSNIMGWSTTLVMSFDEIVSVEKRSTALIFKNGLMISTLHAKHSFASFTSRDSTYDLIVKIWKLGHPTLQSSLNGVQIDETGGDKTEKVELDGSVGTHSIGSGSDDESEDGEDVYDEDEDDGDHLDATQLTDPNSLDTDNEKPVVRKPSGMVAANSGSPDKPNSPGSKDGDDFPGPATHPPTDCGDSSAHYEKFLGDETIPAPLGKVYNMVFGPGSCAWMSSWLVNDQKQLDLQMEDKKGLTQENKTRTYSYIKPLNAALGPKQTKCIVTESIETLDLEKVVTIVCATQTPDVPSGNVFTVKTRYCLTWAASNATRLQANCTIEWTGKSWLKVPIEKGAIDGQTQYTKDLAASLKTATSSRTRTGTLTNGKGRKKGRKSKATSHSGPKDEGASARKSSSNQGWGMFEPIHGVAGPVVDIIKPLLTGNVMYGLLVGLLVATWFGNGFNRSSSRPYGRDLGYFPNHPDRLVAYEEMWRREESELWEWLEDRVGLDRLNGGHMPPPKRVVEPKTVQDRVREDRMDEREIKEAIRVTEEKLRVLKDVVHKQSEPKKPST